MRHVYVVEYDLPPKKQIGFIRVSLWLHNCSWLDKIDIARKVHNHESSFRKVFAWRVYTQSKAIIALPWLFNFPTP